MLSIRKTLGVVLVATVVSACAAFAGKADYRAYRQIELAQDDHARTEAMAEYVREHPDGKWSDEVRTEREQAEPGLFEASKSSRDGLAFYLRVYPEGQFNEQARQRLAALEAVAGSRQAGEKAAQGVRQERRTQTLEERRQWGSKAVSYWARTLLGVENWGSAIGEVASNNAEFNRAFSTAPRPRCSREECIKFYQLGFAIPVPGRTRIDRTLRMMLRLRFDGRDQKLVRAELLMPERGFSRWFELETQQFSEDADPEQRQQAVDWALQRIVPIVREIAPDATGIDVVPEPIDPPRVRAPNQPDPGASAIPGEDTGEAPTQAPEQAETTEAPESDGTLVLPLALQGLQIRNIRVVVFAAADDDEGPAYDGLFLELVED